MPKVGDLRVWSGSGWTTLSTPFMVDPETTGLPPDLGPIEPEDRTWDELLEVLLCPVCDFELGAEACPPDHAFLADNPMQHRLLKPLLALYLKQIRAKDKQCMECQAPLAAGNCPHPDYRDDQVTISNTGWMRIVEDIGALHGLKDRVGDLIEERAAWAEDAVEKVATMPPWNGKLHPAFLTDLRREFRKVS